MSVLPIVNVPVICAFEARLSIALTTTLTTALVIAVTREVFCRLENSQGVVDIFNKRRLTLKYTKPCTYRFCSSSAKTINPGRPVISICSCPTVHISEILYSIFQRINSTMPWSQVIPHNLSRSSPASFILPFSPLVRHIQVSPSQDMHNKIVCTWSGYPLFRFLLKN